MTTAMLNDEAARRIAAAEAKRARRAARQAQTVKPVIESDRPAAASVILPHVVLCMEHGPTIMRIRQAYTRLPLKHAQKLRELIELVAEADELAVVLAEAVYYVEKTEHRLKAKAEQERLAREEQLSRERFPDHVRRLAGVFFPSRPRAQIMFVDRALAIGWGPGNAIETARREAYNWLHPRPTRGAARAHA